jgi:uncharacterized membrane protein (DUF106 family)
MSIQSFLAENGLKSTVLDEMALTEIQKYREAFQKYRDLARNEKDPEKKKEYETKRDEAQKAMSQAAGEKTTHNG